MQIRKYRRYFAVYDDSNELVCLCVYKKGAKEVIRRLNMKGAESYVKEKQTENN